MPQDARSGVAVSGVTRSGDFDQSFIITIAATDRTRKVWSQGSQIEDVQGADPNSFRATARGFAVTEGQEVKAYNVAVCVQNGWNGKQAYSKVYSPVKSAEVQASKLLARPTVRKRFNQMLKKIVKRS